MNVDESIGLLMKYEQEGTVHPVVASEVMSQLILFSHYPSQIVVPGSTDFAFMRKRYGADVMRKLMHHLCEAVAGRVFIMEFVFLPGYEQQLQQDPDIANLMYTMYFKMWQDLREKNIDSFPYVFSSIGDSVALFTQMRGDKLLEAAGL